MFNYLETFRFSFIHYILQHLVKFIFLIFSQIILIILVDKCQKDVPLNEYEIERTKTHLGQKMAELKNICDGKANKMKVR